MFLSRCTCNAVLFTYFKNPFITLLQNIPTVRAAENFNAEADADALKQAMRGWGCDNEEVVSILAKRNSNQRERIEDAYKSMFGKDLVEDLKDELGGNFERVVVALMHPWPQFSARAIKKACEGLGTSEEILIDILCTANNCQIKMIGEAFKESTCQDAFYQLSKLFL